MHEKQPARYRSDEYWEEIRRAWEGGATGASLAKRYDVGLANLWRRRAEEAWERKPQPDPVPEPVEGWARRHGWTGKMWNDEGRLEPLMWLDGVTLHANRGAWREDHGLPEGVAEDWP